MDGFLVKIFQIGRDLKIKDTKDFPQQPGWKEDEVLTDQQLWNQERNSILDQEEPEPPEMKEEQEELCISQEGEVLAVKLEANSLMVTPVSEENDQSEAEPISEQQDEEGSQHVDSGLAEEEEPRTKKRRLTHRSHSNSDDHRLISEIHDEDKTDGLQLHDCKVEEVVAVQQRWNQVGKSCLDQEDCDAAQIKVEEEELCTSQEEQIELKEECEENGRETKSHSAQPLFHNSPDAKTQDQRAGNDKYTSRGGEGQTVLVQGLPRWEMVKRLSFKNLSLLLVLLLLA
ncbi:uncharacterized protein KZ484_025287 [Pholidichthys leucotaenia]